MPKMFLCPSCECHVHAHEKACPHCGESFDTAPSGVRTAAMVMLGIAAVAATPVGCSDSETETDDASTTESSMNTTTNSNNGGSTASQENVSAYGVGAFGGFGGNNMSVGGGGEGGVGGDGGDSGGAGGTGGSGGSGGSGGN